MDRASCLHLEAQPRSRKSLSHRPSMTKYHLLPLPGLLWKLGVCGPLTSQPFGEKSESGAISEWL